ncbi:hypothetical protein N9C96_01060 [bacterium]|nr:hypothetical protein [bacterium]
MSEWSTTKTLNVAQLVLLGWIVLMVGAMVYHLSVAGVIFQGLMPSDPYSDTYYVVHHFGRSAIIFYTSIVMLGAVTFAKWKLSERR